MKTKTGTRTPKAKTHIKAKTIGAKDDTVLVMRQCFYDADGNLESNPPNPGTPFKYPASGAVATTEWDESARCGGGLHGFLWGAGNPQTTGTNMDPALPWLAIRCLASDVVKIDDDKCKFRSGVVERVGPLPWVAAYVAAEAPTGNAVIGSTVSGGYGSTVSGGDGSTVSGGYGSTVSGGYGSTVSGGDGSTVSGGDGSTVSGGDRSTVSGGDGSTVSGGVRSTVSGGHYSTITVKWWDATASRWRLSVAYPGENGIKPGVRYKSSDDGKFIEVMP